MHSDPFEAGVARVRHRFASTLTSKIETAMASVDLIAREDGSVLKHVSDSYRHLHGIYGIGATVGFAATGEAAHAAEDALMPAYREGRGLTAIELSMLRKALRLLRDVAVSELQSMYQRDG